MESRLLRILHRHFFLFINCHQSFHTCSLRVIFLTSHSYHNTMFYHHLYVCKCQRTSRVVADVTLASRCVVAAIIDGSGPPWCVALSVSAPMTIAIFYLHTMAHTWRPLWQAVSTFSYKQMLWNACQHILLLVSVGILLFFHWKGCFRFVFRLTVMKTFLIIFRCHSVLKHLKHW